MLGTGRAFLPVRPEVVQVALAPEPGDEVGGVCGYSRGAGGVVVQDVKGMRTVELEWNNSHLIGGDLAREVSKLKRQPGQDIVIHGSPGFIRSLMPLDLIDEYRLLVYPLALGRGKRLFDETSQSKLKLAESKPFSTGVVKLVYRAADKTRLVPR